MCQHIRNKKIPKQPQAHKLNTSNYLQSQSAAQAWYVRGLNPAGDGRRPPDDKEALRSRVAGHLLEASCSWFGSLVRRER